MICSKNLLKFTIALIAFVVFIPNISYSQYGAPFLNFPPSARINAMGNAGVAANIDPTFSFLVNPAHVASDIEKSNINIGIMPSNVNSYSIFDYASYTLNIGYNFNPDGKSLPLSIGLGYSGNGVDLGEFTLTSSDGKVLGRFCSYESANVLSVGAFLDYGVRFGLGLSYKSISTKFKEITSTTSFNYNASAFDIGAICQIPILNSSIFTSTDNFILDLNLGLSLNNIGNEISSFGEEVEPLPRTASFGYDISAKYIRDFSDVKIKIFTLNFSAELRDYSVDYDSIGIFNYVAPFSHSRPVENLLMLNPNHPVVVNYGLYATIFETFHIAIGQSKSVTYYQDNFTDNYGYGISLDGLMKYLSNKVSGGFANFITNHLSLGYNYSYSSYNNYVDFSYNTIYLTFKGLNVF
ncbi:MAG: hypothetical protein KIT33_06855 [Candidatus Kapabacteria bacterium]|nr:hypothetical protein [Ignavibacteriota bacterium]MCW5884675.1 hypothetical protein [Candidatus Kapabacteria bacterium]